MDYSLTATTSSIASQNFQFSMSPPDVSNNFRSVPGHTFCHTFMDGNFTSLPSPVATLDWKLDPLHASLISGTDLNPKYLQWFGSQSTSNVDASMWPPFAPVPMDELQNHQNHFYGLTQPWQHLQEPIRRSVATVPTLTLSPQPQYYTYNTY